MSKVFLSHSSKDKKSYVDIVAKQLVLELGQPRIVYDSLTFEEGMKSFEEIEKGLEKADLFVLFLSDTSLDSRWVKEELSNAYVRLKDGRLYRIFPIIIDPTVTHNDSRIPEWMRNEYNLKYVSRPTVASRRIIQRLREISWSQHPRLLEKERIFKGRNRLIEQFEQRVDTFDLPIPLAFIASGMPGIGRKAFLRYCLVKADVVDESYRPPLIFLNTQESIEDMILKIYNLGFSERLDLTDLMKKSLEEKISLVSRLLLDIQTAKEILLVEDSGCLLRQDGTLALWYLEILEKLVRKDLPAMAIASKYRLKHALYRERPYLFALEVPELSKEERIGLLKRYAEFEQLHLAQDDYIFLGNLLQGFPDQVFYAVELIKEKGNDYVHTNSSLIVEFNTEKAMLLMAKYEENERALDFLVLLSKFDFIPYNMVFEWVEGDIYYSNLLEELAICSIVEYLGANREHLRLTAPVRDYILRTRMTLSEKYMNKIENHLKEFLNSYEKEDKDISDVLFSVKQLMLSGKKVDEKYLIPSYFLKTMKELYDQRRNYKDVILLAYQVIDNASTIDESILNEIRYFLCLSLAREKDNRFLNEVQNIRGTEHDFLFGFYYRVTGNYNKSIERLERALAGRQYAPARRELVNVYILLEEFDKALEMAKTNYEEYKSNPYHIQAYFNCVLRQQSFSNKEVVLHDLIVRLNKLKTDVAREMAHRCEAEYYAFVEDNRDEALAHIDAGLSDYPDSIYLRITKFNICEKFRDLSCMKQVTKEMESLVGDNVYYQTKLLMSQIIYKAMEGDEAGARRLLTTKLNRLPESAVKKLEDKIARYSVD